MLEMLLPGLISLVVGVLLVPVGKFLLNLNADIDGLNPWIKRAIMAVLSLGAAFATAKTAVLLPENPLVMDSTTLTALLTLAFNQIVYFVTKKSPTP